MTQTLIPEVEIVETGGIADLSALQSQLDAEKQAATEALHAAVIATARGKTPDDLRAILSAAGVSVDEFQQSVAVLVSRLAAQKQVTEAAELEPRIDAARTKAAELREQVDREEAEFEERIRAMREAAADAGGEFERLEAYRRSILDQADATLHRTASPVITDKLAELDERRHELVAERNRQVGDGIAAYDAKIRALDDQKRQLELDRRDPLAGLCLGQREQTPEERTSKTWDWWRRTFGSKTVSGPHGTYRE